ncbi:MAG: thiamine biosynthesis protein ThiF [Alphaproteobacteria bacterium]|nr:thiamine biosynthesis protein ThiF [Alphaproteobacteria bacterium]
MTHLEEVADRLNRMVKLALDTGEASSLEEAQRIFAGYRLQIIVGADVAQEPVLQAALLTAVNCAVRTLLGGVTVVGATGALRVLLPPFGDLEEAIVGLGGRLIRETNPETSTLVIGEVDEKGLEPLAIRATFNEWCGGVVPVANHERLAETGAFTPAGVLAGALGVSEIFQRLRGGMPMACRRGVGLNLWRPERDWLRGEFAPALDCLPSAAWLVGLGNLGQAYLWTLGLLPYGGEGAELVLQDIDVLAPSNLSTSLLTTPERLGRRKTRAMADWAEVRGFKTAIIERGFGADFHIGPREPPVALIGVDNALARQSVEDVGFERVIEAGLGGGLQDFLGIDLHTFPASKPAREVWRDTAVSDIDLGQPAYKAMLEQSKDQCGIVRLAGRTVGAPFVGSAAAALVIAELMRLTLGGARYEMISCHLRDLEGRFVVGGNPWSAFNPGGIRLAA